MRDLLRLKILCPWPKEAVRQHQHRERDEHSGHAALPEDADDEVHELRADVAEPDRVRVSGWGTGKIFTQTSGYTG
jgi:hypothetical protein